MGLGAHESVPLMKKTSRRRTCTFRYSIQSRSSLRSLGAEVARGVGKVK